MLDDVVSVLAPLARVDWQFREHDPSKHLIFVSLEAKSHDLEANARENSAARCIDQICRDQSHSLVHLNQDVQQKW